MASHLHSRRKHHNEDDIEETPRTPSRSNSSSSHGKDSGKEGTVNPLLAIARSLKRRKSKEGGSEVRAALMSVVAFLTVGVFLGYFLLQTQHTRVILHVMKNPWAHGGAVLKGRVGFQHHFYSGSPRYVSVVMPSVVNPKDRRKRLKSIQDTWGPFARSIFVMSNITEFPPAETHHAIISEDADPGDPYSYPQALMVPPHIGDENGVPRLKYVIKAIYERVNPDYAFFVNDHTFVIPEHLCNYLQDLDPLEDLYAGHAMKTDNSVFNSGAAGYLFSRTTMKKLVKIWDEGTDPNCVVDPNNQKMRWLQGNPGLLTTNCLHNSLNVSAIDTREDHRYHRFHAFPLTRCVSGKVDDWYKNKHTVETARKIGADDSYAIMLNGEDCCAKSSVSFHYVEHMEARALFAVRERLLANPRMTDYELKTLMITEWPKNKKEIGHYSAPLPEASNLDEWKSLLKTIRKITTRETQRDC